MPNTKVRRDKGIPGSDAAEQVKAMGGPIAQRASRKTVSEPANKRTAAGPGVIDLKTRSRQWADDEDEVQVVAEDPPNSDSADIEDWTPPHTTFAERRRRVAEERTRANENAPVGNIPRRRTTTDDITPKRRSSGRRETDQLPRERRRVHWVVPVFTGMLLLIVLYTVCFWVYSFGLGASNRISYGPTLTSEVSAVLGQGDSRANPSPILVSNVGGRIIVTILPGGDTTKALVYQAPALEPSMWGNLSDVVATIEVQQHSATPNIYIHLVGDPDYWHFYSRPSLTVTLVHAKQQGFKVMLGSQQ